jgi:4-amino-4-deoxy-L-arabinose transferase-like glycosyltransferase
MTLDDHINTDPEYWEETAGNMVRSRTFQIGVAVFLVSFVLRFILREHGLWIDEGRALMIAKSFIEGNGFRVSERQLFAKHPFMFYTLIAVAYLFLGVTKNAGIAVALVLGALTCMLVFLIGNELFNKYAGIAAAAFLVVNPLHVFYSSRILTEVPVTFFVTLSLYVFVRAEQRDERWSFYATFAAAGLAILTKMSAIVLLPTLFLYYLMKERKQLFLQKQYWIAAGLPVALYGIWEIRTWISKGESAFLGVLSIFLRSGGGDEAATAGASSIIDIAFGAIGRIVEGAVMHGGQPGHLLGWGATLFLFVGIAAAYIYQDTEKMTIPLLFMGVSFTILSMRHIIRYSLPFVPMALVVAGYGADRMRRGVRGINPRLGIVVFAGVLAVAGFFTFQYTGAMTTQQSQGFTGLEEAGKWIRANAPEDAGVIAGSGHQIRFFADRPTWHAGNVDNRSHMNRLITEENYVFIEMDRWESTQPQWFQQYVQTSDAFQPVNAVRRGNQPIVVVYQVTNTTALER